MNEKIYSSQKARGSHHRDCRSDPCRSERKPRLGSGKERVRRHSRHFRHFPRGGLVLHNGDTVKAHDLAKDGKRVVLRTWAYDPPAPGHMPPDSQIEKRRLDVTGGTGSYGTANYNFPEGWRVRIQICLQDGYDGTPTSVRSRTASHSSLQGLLGGQVGRKRGSTSLGWATRRAQNNLQADERGAYRGTSCG